MKNSHISLPLHGPNVKIILYDKKTGKTVKGVKLKLLKSDFETVDEWETDGKEHEIKDLVLDETYTLEEEVPEGYEAVDALKFKVDKDGNILKLNEDGTTTPIGDDGTFPVNIVPTEISFQINKVDAGTGEEVEGAVLTVIEKGEDDEETVLERWTSKKGETHDFGSKLERGKQYLLREVTAPVGYGKLTTDIAISVNEDGTIKTALDGKASTSHKHAASDITSGTFGPSRLDIGDIRKSGNYLVPKMPILWLNSNSDMNLLTSTNTVLAAVRDNGYGTPITVINGTASTITVSGIYPNKGTTTIAARKSRLFTFYNDDSGFFDAY